RDRNGRGVQSTARGPWPCRQAALRAPRRRYPADDRGPRHAAAHLARQLPALPRELLPQALQAGGYAGALRVPRRREPLQGPQERAQRAPGRESQAPGQARQARQVSAAATTLGLLAGGRATRLDGADKAWLERRGQAQVLRLAQRVEAEVDAVLVSANRDLERYASHGLAAIADRRAGLGPLGGLEVLADA